MTGVQTCALPICFPVTILDLDMKGIDLDNELKRRVMESKVQEAEMAVKALMNSIMVGNSQIKLNNQQAEAITDKEMAKEDGLELGNRHFDVLEYLRDQQKKDVALTIRGGCLLGCCSFFC